MPKVDGPTFKERMFAKAYVANLGNQTHAALASYNTTKPATANAIAREALERPRVQSLIQEEIERILKEVDVDSLDERTIAASIADMAFNGENSESTRLKGRELLAKWKAMLTDKNINENTDKTAQEDLIRDRAAKMALEYLQNSSKSLTDAQGLTISGKDMVGDPQPKETEG